MVKNQKKVDKLIPVFRPSYDKREVSAVTEVLMSGWIGLGPKTEEFEEKFAKHIGAKYAVALNSATAALHLSLMAANIGIGDEVILPAMTFASTAHAVLYVGAKPVFADIEKNTMCVDPYDVEKKITKKTKIIIPVHYGGYPCNMDSLQEIARKHKLLIIEDAAHACGSVYKGRMVGNISAFTCFSFHAVKNLATGDGGMITTNDRAIMEELKRLRWVGITKDTWNRVEKVKEAGLESNRGYGWHYEIYDLGYKYHMNDINAALGLVQLTKLENANRIRRKIARYYQKSLTGVGDIVCPTLVDNSDGTISSQHNYVIRTKFRDKLHLYLRQQYISTGVHYMPIHLHPLYRKLCPNTKLPVTEEEWKRVLTLPLYPDLTKKDQDRIIETIHKFFKINNVGNQLSGNKNTSIKYNNKHPLHKIENSISQHIAIRKLRVQDLETLRIWRNENRKYFYDSKLISKETQVKWFIQNYKNNPNDTIYIVSYKSKPVGALGLIKRGKDHELGRVMLGVKRFARRGVMGEAMEKLLNNLKERSGKQRVILEVIKTNTPAIKFYELHKFNKVSANSRGVVMERFI